MTCFIITVLYFANEINLSVVGNKGKKSKLEKDSVESVVYKKRAQGPKRKFFIGNLDELGGFETPFQAFGNLAKKYGDIFSLQMGNVPAIVVNGYENIKEVLLTKSDKFDGRPNFQRFVQLFGGDKNNCKF